MDESVSNSQPARKLFFKHILRKIFLEDWALKLLALIITFALWLGVTGLSTPTKSRINVPLNLGVSSDAQLTNVPQQQVEIEISGDKRKVDQIARGELTAFVDLTEMKPGEWVVSLSPDTVFVPLPQGVKLVDVVPGRIGVNIEAVEEKELEVKAETTGNVAAGYEIYNSTVLPSRIRVRGPSSIIRILEYVQTERVDIEGKKDGFTARQIAVTSPDPKAAVLNTVVDVDFRIGEKRIERRFAIKVDGDHGKTARFTLFGPRTLLAKLRAEEIKVEMYLDGNGELQPRVLLPDEMKDRFDVRELEVSP
jgi:YbbR domain-containing protein